MRINTVGVNKVLSVPGHACRLKAADALILHANFAAYVSQENASARPPRPLQHLRIYTRKFKFTHKHAFFSLYLSHTHSPSGLQSAQGDKNTQGTECPFMNAIKYKVEREVAVSSKNAPTLKGV